MSDILIPRPHQIARYGWVPDLPDARDHRYQVVRGVRAPAHVDLRPQCPPVYDQLALGSCTGNAIAAAIQFDRAKQALAPDFVPSRLWIYYQERVIEHTISQDAGAMIRDGIKAVAKLGVPPEADWPYDIARFTHRPPTLAYEHARPNRAVSYARVSRTLGSMRNCLAAGYPFVFGFSVYESFESDEVANTGTAPLPTPKEQLLGGHAVLAVGYDSPTGRFIVRNSWGDSWGDKGYFTLPFEYLTNPDLADDFWVIRVVGGAGA